MLADMKFTKLQAHLAAAVAGLFLANLWLSHPELPQTPWTNFLTVLIRVIANPLAFVLAGCRAGLWKKHFSGGLLAGGLIGVWLLAPGAWGAQRYGEWTGFAYLGESRIWWLAGAHLGVFAMAFWMSRRIRTRAVRAVQDVVRELASHMQTMRDEAPETNAKPTSRKVELLNQPNEDDPPPKHQENTNYTD
jgi:hypothetical protein